MSLRASLCVMRMLRVCEALVTADVRFSSEEEPTTTIETEVSFWTSGTEDLRPLP